MTRKKLNKSAKIRDALRTAPRARTSEIVAMLGARGIKVTPVLVSNVRARMAEAADKHGSVRRPTGNEPSLNDLLAAKRFADHVGGHKSAASLIEALFKLQ